MTNSLQISNVKQTLRRGREIEHDEDFDDLVESIRDHGLIQLIGLNQDNELIWGGHRLEALAVLGVEVLHEGTHFVRRETTSTTNLRLLELHENLRRKQTNWIDRCLAIAEIHRINKREHALQSEAWLESDTARELGIRGRSNVNYALRVAELLEANDPIILECKDMSAAVSVLLRRAQDAAMQRNEELSKAEMQLNRARPIIVEETIGADFDDDLTPQSTSILDLELGDVEVEEEKSVEKIRVDLSKFCIHGDCIETMRSMSAESFDHILTDPPYARDMDDIKGNIMGGSHQGGIVESYRLEDEHDVETNLKLFGDMWPLFYKALRDKSFCVVWCAWPHFALHQQLAIKAGFRVQPWPNVWVKTFSPSNKAASKNFTSATEWCIVARKGDATLTKQQAYNYKLAEKARTESNKFAKPLPLWAWLIYAIAIHGQEILDPFAGEGSSIAAMIAAGMRPTAIESSDLHYPYLFERMKQLYANIYHGQVEFI